MQPNTTRPDEWLSYGLAFVGAMLKCGREQLKGKWSYVEDAGTDKSGFPTPNQWQK